MKNFFHFTRSERRGLYALAVVLMILLIIKLCIRYIPFNHIEELDLESIHEKIDSLEKVEFLSAKTDSVPAKTSTKTKKDSFFIFDPNQLNPEGWENLGLSKKQIQVILNYKKKGGTFYKKEDLKKIYVIDSVFYTKLEPYIQINRTDQYKDLNKPVKHKEKKTPLKLLKINLNTSNKETLQKIKGIGEVYASRIIKYRDLLGGFACPEQLLEVYGFTPQLLNSIKDNVFADTLHINQISINQASAKDLAKHPYISWNIAKLIVNYKKNHGNYRSKEDLLNLKLIDSVYFNKIKPYIIL